MVLYVTHHKNGFTRFLYSYFVQTPLTVWFRWLSRLTPGSSAIKNYTSFTDKQLSDAWEAACLAIGTKPFPISSSTTSPLHPMNPDALLMKPTNVTVVACPDEPVADLVKLDAAWSKHTDPSGVILQLIGFQYNTDVAFTTATWARPRVYAAASQVLPVVQYEFENIIIERLGYDVSAR